jgi:hypothetical protein
MQGRIEPSSTTVTTEKDLSEKAVIAEEIP